MGDGGMAAGVDAHICIPVGIFCVGVLAGVVVVVLVGVIR